MKPTKQYPEPTVGALVFNDKNQLLIVKTHKWKGNYTIPGGHVEMGEYLEDALKREILEETGLNMVKAKYLCYQEFVFDDSFWEKRHFIFFDFVCRVEDGVVQLNEEAQDYAWVDIDKIDDYPVDGYLKHSLDLIQEDPHILE
ncbi:MAG TPA: NUDIX domain-containing protein [Chloroflexi bacterium]|nr:MAG: ADP-ribose pyrophosphatase [Chloroflexota bacterium]HDN05250.1 NUDIX domain-containing protein [Chloroflexota bacterium]